MVHPIVREADEFIVARPSARGLNIIATDPRRPMNRKKAERIARAMGNGAAVYGVHLVE